MEVLFPTIFLVLLGFVLLLNVITLPANWIMLGLIGLWRFAYPSPGDMGVFFFAMLVGLALFGEVIEYIAQGWGARNTVRHQRHVGGPGALVGALAGLPLLFGLGAFIGALVGAWIGCYLMERYKGRNDYEARQAAKGALVGRFLGIVVKCGIGAVMLGLTCHAIFQVPVYPEVTTF
ncbi:MAG: DUF456 domain-containing protein [Bilophila wadsworthia]